MPLKRTVLPLLDRIDPLVADAGCANTVLFAAAQRLGHNTDVAGIARALAEHGVGSGARGPGGAPLASGGGEPAQARPVGPALILGSGGQRARRLPRYATWVSGRSPSRSEVQRGQPTCSRPQTALALRSNSSRSRQPPWRAPA